MAILGKMASGAERVMTSRAGRAAIIGGAIGVAATGHKSANNESMRSIMNAVIGTPEDGPGADEILLGRKLELQDMFNPLAPYIPDVMPSAVGPGWRNLKYAIQDGPGLINPAVADMRGAMQKRQAFMNESIDTMMAEGMTANTSTRFNPPKQYNDLNASGDIVFGLHRRRFGG